MRPRHTIDACSMRVDAGRHTVDACSMRVDAGCHPVDAGILIVDAIPDRLAPLLGPVGGKSCLLALLEQPLCRSLVCRGV